MLHLRGDDVLPAVPRPVRHTFHREIVGLGPGAREDDLEPAASVERGDLRPRILHRLADVPPRPVDAGRVPEEVGEKRLDGGRHLRVDRGRGVVVEIHLPQTPTSSRVSRPVSYTHLRAHETDSYLVCRL